MADSYKPFKMKGNPMKRNFGNHIPKYKTNISGINNESEGNTDLPDGRSASSAFQKRNNPSIRELKRTLRKKGYKKDFDNIKVKGTVKKKAKLKEATTGCKGTCVLKVNGETVATVGCDSGPRGCECGGIQGAGCGGSGQTVINLTPDLKKFKR